MTARRTTTRPARAAAPDEGDAPPKLDGRRAHVLDRAAEYVRLADQGLSAAQIARRRRKSAGHVSILLRLGRALATVPEEERAALRSPRITWRLVQRLVRTDVDAASLRKQLRDAVGGFSTHNLDARQRRRRRAAGVGPATSAPVPGVGWGWDAAWFASDAVGYATAHLAHLTHVHHVVAARAAHAVRAQADGSLAGVDTGQSLRGLQRRLRQLVPADAPAPTPQEHQALAIFAALGRALHDAETAAAALGVSDVAVASVRDGAARPTTPPAGASPTTRATVTDDELAADLDEP